MKRTVLFSIVILFIYGEAAAQLIPALGRERAGTASATFLKIGVGAKAGAMGQAFVSLANDPSALYWNPAGITQLQGTTLQFSYLQYVADISHQFFGLVHQLSPADALGISLIALQTDEMKVTTEVRPFGTGETFRFTDFMIGISYARQLTDRFSAGLTAKYIQENLYTVSTSGFLIDVGTIYDTGWRGSRFAVSISNFGADLQPRGGITDFLGNPVPEPRYQTFPAPLMFRIGFSIDLLSREKNRALLAFQLDHPNDDAERFNIGTEYRLQDSIVLRAGYRKKELVGGFTLGFGLDLPVKGMNLKLDYAFSEYGPLGNLNRFDLKLSL